MLVRVETLALALVLAPILTNRIPSRDDIVIYHYRRSVCTGIIILLSGQRGSSAFRRRLAVLCDQTKTIPCIRNSPSARACGTISSNCAIVVVIADVTPMSNPLCAFRAQIGKFAPSSREFAEMRLVLRRDEVLANCSSWTWNGDCCHARHVHYTSSGWRGRKCELIHAYLSYITSPQFVGSH